MRILFRPIRARCYPGFWWTGRISMGWSCASEEAYMTPNDGTLHTQVSPPGIYLPTSLLSTWRQRKSTLNIYNNVYQLCHEGDSSYLSSGSWGPSAREEAEQVQYAVHDFCHLEVRLASIWADLLFISNIFKAPGSLLLVSWAWYYRPAGLLHSFMDSSSVFCATCVSQPVLESLHLFGRPPVVNTILPICLGTSDGGGLLHSALVGWASQVG